MTPEAFFSLAVPSAISGGHIWPNYAACEAALESAWGESELAKECCNLMGQKQGRKIPLPYPTVDWNTHEIIHGMELIKKAAWLKFPDWATSFRERMALLRRLPIYLPALQAATGEDFIREVGGCWIGEGDAREYISRWSTDPRRADKVLEIYARHATLLRLD